MTTGAADAEGYGPFASPRVRNDGTMMPPMISYAQNLEDVMLRRALQDVSDGFYVDVGAFDPIEDSVTKAFYDARWRGINVEPNPRMWRRLCRARPRDINLQVALADKSGSATFHILRGEGLSTLSPALHDDPMFEVSGTVVAEIMTLRALAAAHINGTVDFLKVDVEGAEEAVIRGADLNNFRPRIILIEATQPGTQLPAWEDWEPLLVRQGYQFVWFDGLNRFYLREEDAWRKRYFEIPPSCFDAYVLHDAVLVRENTAAAGEVTHLARRLTEMVRANRFLDDQVHEAKRGSMFFEEQLSISQTRLAEMHDATVALNQATEFLERERKELADVLASERERIEVLFEGLKHLEGQLAEAKRAHAVDTKQLEGAQTRLAGMHSATISLREATEFCEREKQRLVRELKDRDQRLESLFDTVTFLANSLTYAAATQKSTEMQCADAEQRMMAMHDAVMRLTAFNTDLITENSTLTQTLVALQRRLDDHFVATQGRLEHLLSVLALHSIPVEA